MSFTIRSAFRKTWFASEFTSRPLRLRFSEDFLRAKWGFSEIWNFNISVDQLSKQQQSHQSGLIKADFLAKLSDEQITFSPSFYPAIISCHHFLFRVFQTFEPSKRTFCSNSWNLIFFRYTRDISK
jgi:hypothetical protein